MRIKEIITDTIAVLSIIAIAYGLLLIGTGVGGFDDTRAALHTTFR